MTGAARDWAREFNTRIAGTMIASHETRFVLRNTNRGTLRAETTAVHKGRTTVVVQGTVTDSEGRLIDTVTTTHVVPGS